MSYNIDQVNGDSSSGQIDEARRQANAAIDVIAKEEAVVEVQKRENAGKEVEVKRDIASYEDDLLKESTAQDSAEATVTEELVMQGAPAAIQLASTGAQILTDRKQSDPGHIDSKKLNKQTNGMVSSADTMESVIDRMKSSGAIDKVGSFQSLFDKGEDLLARSKIQSTFSSESKTTGMAVPPDSINVNFVKSLTQDLGQKAHYEMTLANASRAEQTISPKMGGPGLNLNGMGNGPKFREPKDERVQDDTTAWA